MDANSHETVGKTLEDLDSDLEPGSADDAEALTDTDAVDLGDSANLDDTGDLRDDAEDELTGDLPALPSLPARPRDGHKGTFGHVLVLGGSAYYTGAPILTARAALRSGCGIVTAGCPATAYSHIAPRLLCEICHPLGDEPPGVFSRQAVSDAMIFAERTDVVVLGPGISLEPAASSFARDMSRLCAQPMVLDADGLNAFTGRPTDLRHRAGPRVLTPHPGEAARMLGWPLEDVQKDREAAARELAEATQTVIVLKGAHTLVCDVDRLEVVMTGNSGMATAGSGDVLAGTIAALAAQGMELFDAAWLGAHLHGLAGDIAAETVGEYGMIATDILDTLPAAFMQHQQSHPHDTGAITSAITSVEPEPDLER